MSDPELRELGHGSFAYLQRGGWGYSNAGLVTSGEASLLVDTLYDLRLTQAMLAAMRRATPAAARIDSVVNTHANGDHCWGNQLVSEARIISSRRAAEEMLELSPRLMHTLVQTARRIVGGGAVGALVRLIGRLGVKPAGALAEAAPLVVEAFGSFQFGDIQLRAPDQTFDGTLTLQVGDKRVELIEVGPAHTQGDVIVYVPEDRVAFSGDILFIGSHPIIWAGPIDNWVRACDRLLALDVDVIVPGHGPLTDKAGVRATRDYWLELQRLAQRARDDGQDAASVAQVLSRQHAYAEAERVIINVEKALAELNGRAQVKHPLEHLAQMARFAGRSVPAS